jgi:hypothetical protein
MTDAIKRKVEPEAVINNKEAVFVNSRLRNLNQFGMQNKFDWFIVIKQTNSNKIFLPQFKIYLKNYIYICTCTIMSIYRW